MLAFEPAAEPESAMVGYGLGLSRHDVDGAVAYGHLGGTAGFQSFMLYAPGTDLYFSGTMNEMGDLGALLAPLVLRIARP
jgi:CubicO group peptidase (beta-lactamase class C family)